MKITIEIPDGMRCVDDRMKRCKLCAYIDEPKRKDDTNA